MCRHSILKNHYPLKQGLRLPSQVFDKVSFPAQKPLSTKTRIKTPSGKTHGRASQPRKSHSLSSQAQLWLTRIKAPNGGFGFAQPPNITPAHKKPSFSGKTRPYVSTSEIPSSSRTRPRLTRSKTLWLVVERSRNHRFSETIIQSSATPAHKD